jgi:nucleoside-diphosphate-sugar epimerase
MKRILITGAVGQIGSELTLALREKYGGEAVVASDVKLPQDTKLLHGGPFEFVDCLDPHHITRVMQIHKIDTIFHLAALLSAVGESRPLQAWQLNVNGLVNMLEAGRQYGCAMFFPSSIGAFGPGTPRDATPQVTVQRPTTMYGVTKVVGELLCDDYFRRFNMDTRGLRFPGLISSLTDPGGGTTD